MLPRLVLLLPIVALLAPAGAHAQQFSYGQRGPQAVQAVYAGYASLDFTYRGEGEPPISFAFDQPVYSLSYSRPGFLGWIAYGEQSAAGRADDRPLRLLDASLTTWGTLLFSERVAAGRSGFFVPVALHSGYRRVSPEGEENSLTESFNVTVLGLGAGGGFTGVLGERARVEARATPILGLAVRSFGDSAGHSRLVDADVQLHLHPVAGRFGLSAGYGYRYQVWDVGSSSLLANLTADLFDYGGSQHSFRVGISW